MNTDELKRRSERFALDAMKLVGKLPSNQQGRVIGNQFLRAATSVGANYRAATRAWSHAEFIAKIGTVEEEADECCYWLELVIEGNLLPASRVTPLLKEAQELTAIFTASGRTARLNSNRESRSAKRKAVAGSQSAVRAPRSSANPRSEISDSAPIRNSKSAIRDNQ
jgi:four helix bundle protein